MGGFVRERRRHDVKTNLCHFLAIALAFLISQAHAGNSKPTVIPLWQGTPPAGSGRKPVLPEHLVRETATSAGLVKDVGEARMVVLHPRHPNGTAVLVIGGGGYVVIAMAQEAMPAAHWLMTLGVTPVVLYYRLPGDGWAPVAPFQDVQRAMRLLRRHAAAWGIDPQHIGVLGFSAGGNLAGIIATRSGHDFYPPYDAADKIPARPDFAALIYPVSSLAGDHSGTRTQLMAQKDAVVAYSVQDHVSAHTPPVFIVQAENDPVVDVDDSLSLFRVLHQHEVPVEMHLFARGKHGFGMGRPNTRTMQWPRLFAGWMRDHGWLVPAGESRAAFTGNPG